MLKLITIQKVYAENKPLHSFLVSKGLNKQTTPFFFEYDLYGNSSILMLSSLGNIFRLCSENVVFKLIRVEDPSLLKQVLSIVDNAVVTNKYPFFRDTLSVIKKNLSYASEMRLF